MQILQKKYGRRSNQTMRNPARFKPDVDQPLKKDLRIRTAETSTPAEGQRRAH